MFQKGDVVCLLPDHEIDEYDTVRHGKISGFVLTKVNGIVAEPNPNTPPGHHVIYYDYTMSYHLVTIPWQDLQFVRSATMFNDFE